MRSIAFVFVFAAALLFACDNRGSAGEHGDEGNHSEHSDASADHHDDEHASEADASQVHTHDAVGLTLDNGKKWKINPEMMPHISAARLAFSNFLFSKEENKDHKALAATLKQHDDELIKSCTMQGESHEQLHAWLIPHIDLVADLAESEAAENVDQIVKKLQASFTAFDAHFE